jgi:hypothetical protein
MSVVYKIVGGGLTYYGSTDFFSIRKNCHKSAYKRWLKGKGRYSTSFEVMKEDYQFVIVEEVKTYEKGERERWYIKNNECVNKLLKI